MIPRACHIHQSRSLCNLLIQKLINVKIYEPWKPNTYVTLWESRVTRTKESNVCTSQRVDKQNPVAEWKWKKWLLTCSRCNLLIQRYSPWIHMVLGHQEQDPSPKIPYPCGQRQQKIPIHNSWPSDPVFTSQWGLWQIRYDGILQVPTGRQSTGTPGKAWSS